MFSKAIFNGLIKSYIKIEKAGLEVLEIDKDDEEILRAADPWTAPHRNEARTIIEKLCYAAVDLRGLPRFALPAEYVATCIYTFVHPNNWQIACHIVSIGTLSAEDVEIEQEPERVSPRKMFAMICEASAENDAFGAKVTKKTRRNVERITADAT